MGLRLLALSFLVGAAFAGPFQRETGSRCSTRCPINSHPKFQYELGKKYMFEYRGENYITIAGNRKQKATIEGLAEFHYVSRCDGVLKLKNVRISQKLSEREMQELVKELAIPVSYSYEDGKIEKVCPSPKDSKHSLNIKKGVLSAIINTMSKLDTPQQVKEEDSLGKCLTKYTVKYNNGVEIQKVKDLKSCTNRHSSVTSLITKPYDSPNSRIHTLPVFPEEHLVCKQWVKDKFIQRVECTEHAKIKPMKNRESVIEFDGTIELKYLSHSPSDLEQIEASNGPESILYNLEEHSDLKTREEEVKSILREMCSKNNGVMDITVSKDFIKLVSLVKTLPYNTLEEIHNSLKDGQLCSSKKVRDLFIDTLPMAGTDSTIKLLVHLIEKKEITGLKAKLWPASLALIPKPTRKTIAAIKPLLMMVDSAPILLGVSAMLHRFCASENCESVPEVREIINQLNSHLGRRCSSKQDEMVFSILKAFGNIGYLGEAEETIIACAKSNQKSLRLRLAAVDAFRRVNEKRPEQLLAIYLDSSENFELRISVLSSALKHADDMQLRKIKQAIENERNTQVSAYASTLINNMKKSSTPHKKNVKKLLHEIEVNPPKVNYWENSKNIEFSAHNEALNVGGSVESDVIHDSESKIPQALYSRFDLDLFDRSINLMEFGVRAEGLEELVRKLMGLKQETKMQKWDLFTAKNIWTDSKADLSLFFRTMNVELFDVSASDITALGEMIKIAEMMTKLSHERKADFSHSFLFLNSQLVIPSVTGRSYSLGLTGSATVALTASTKLNLLAFPRNADAKAHFQPSVNVEVSTTVGIQSNKQRPDLKLVSRMHMESAMEAEFQITEGHVALAKLSMPSENIAMAKFSSDVFEIQADHSEKRVFETMQKKIDYCLDKLEKPLGLSVCARWEVPKPFVIKSFPFIQGVGEVEVAIKKTDSSFSSYELSLEIPNRQSPQMKFQASLDTPGSTVNRLFAVEMDVKEKSRYHKELSMEITSPFRSAGGKGALIKKSDLIEGTLELHSESTQLFAINASTSIAASRTKTSYKPTLELSVLGGHPLKVGGSVSMSKGRKQQISIDIKSNKPSSKPLAIKGTILKEGKIEMSMRSDWKVSSDLQVVTPLLSSQVRGSLEKKSGPLNKLSTSLSVDYEFRNMQKESVKLTALTQKSSSKVNTNARFQSTQFPSVNWEGNWDMQGELQENLKNDITIKYGRNPERNQVTLKHTCLMPSRNQIECSFAVMVPQLNIDGELKVRYIIKAAEIPKLRMEADLRYKNDKHVILYADFENSSKRPLKATTRVGLDLPSGTHIEYTDQINETSPRHFIGKSLLTYKEKSSVLKYAEFEYRVILAEQHQLGLHYEAEGSLKTSYSSTPMKTKLAYHQEGSRLGIEGQLSVRRNAEYSIEAQLTKSGSSHLSVKSPQGEGNWKINNEPLRKSAEWDMKLKSRRSRRVAGSIDMDLESEKKFSFEIMPDADRHPEKKIAASSSVSIQGDSFNSHAKLQVNDIISVSITESGDVSSWKMYECSMEASSKHFEPTEIQYKHDVSDSQGKSSVTVTKNGVPKVRAEIEGSTALIRNQRECSVRAALESLDNSFESKEFSMRHGLSNSGTYKTLKSEVMYQHSPRKVYKAEFNSDIQLEGMELNAVVNTPLKNFEQQSLGVSLKRSDDSISSSVSISIPNNKVISLSTDIETKNRGISATWKAKTPFDIVRDVKVHLSLENQRSKKAIFSFIDVNSARIADIEANMNSQSGSLDLDGQLKVSPIPNVSFQGASFSYHHSRSAQSVSGKINLANSKQLSWSSEIKEEGSSISTTTSISTPFNQVKSAKVHLSIEHDSSKKSLLSYVDVNEERKGDVEVKIISSPQKLEIQGRLKTSKTPEISAHLNIERSHGALSANAKVLKGTSPLWSTVVSKQRSQNGDQLSIKAESFEKTLVDLQVSSDMSSEEMKLSVKASGKFSPVSLSISSDLSDRKHAKMQMMLCKESSNKCYTLKAHHKNLKNSRNYHLYRQVMVELERSSKSSDSEPLGSLEFLLASSGHEYNSKILLKMQEKNLGYEVKVHRRHHENEPCSMEMQMYMPERTSTLSAHVLHSSRNMQWDMELVPSTSAPEKKLSIEVKRETSNNQMSGHIKIHRPDMPKPIMIKGQLEKRGLIPVKGKVEMHYSPSSWFKVLTLEIMPEEDRSGKKSIMYRLYREDESVDMSMKLMKQQSRHEDMYGYHWSIKSDRMTKKGGVSVTVQKTRNGKPETIQIAYYAPNADVKIEGKSMWSEMVSDSGIVVMSRGRKIKEIRVRTKDSCLYFEVERSGPFFRSSLCLNKREGRNLQLVALDARCRSKQCLNVKVAVDPNSSNFVDVTMEWKKEELRRSLNEITGLSNILRGDMLRKMKHELKEKIQRLVREELKPTWRMVMRKYSEIRGKYMQILKNILRKHSEDVKESMKKIESLKQSIIKNIEDIVPWKFIESEILKPLRATIACLTEGFFKTVMTHIPDMINIIWDSLKSQFSLCFKKLCTNGSFCYEFRKNYERYGLRYVKRELKKKAEQTKASVQEAMSSFLSPFRLLRIVIQTSYRAVKKLTGTIIYNFLRPYKMIFNIIHFFTETLNEVFGKFFAKVIFHRIVDMGKKIEDLIRHRAINLIDYVIRKFNDIIIHAKKDEDVRTAISLVKDAKKKAIRSWRSRDDLAKQAWEPVEASVKDNLKKLIRERFELTQYEPSEGMIKFRLRNPFGRAQLQVIKNEILSVKRKFVQWMQH